MYYTLLFFLALCFNFTAPLSAQGAVSVKPSEKPTVIVSVAPHKFFVDKIAGNTVNVYLMVPAGASSHTYEPTPKQMLTASKANLWFIIGESFEKRASQALRSHNPNFKTVDMRQGLDLITTDHTHGHKGCCPAGADLHIWLSARMAQIQGKTIADALIASDPVNKELYQNNLKTFIQELKDLDSTIQSILAPLQDRTILVSHPAYAYFARDYNLKQQSIEVEGKDPTPQQMTKLLNLARQLKVKTIFIQPQYNNKAAQLVSKELGTRLVSLDPYAEDYLKTMLAIAHAFAEN
jgi:zinc transport system substrate-binding protein